MTRNLLILTLLVAGTAGATHAETASAPDSIAVNVSGLSPNAAQSALSDAARKVCQTEEVDPLSTSTSCYDQALARALHTFRRLRRNAGTAAASSRLTFAQR